MHIFKMLFYNITYYRHGFGHMVFSDGSVYDGEWEMDEIQGRGAMHRFDGCILEGHWLAGIPNGCMTFTWPHGSTEYREYRNGDILRGDDGSFFVYRERNIAIEMLSPDQTRTQVIASFCLCTLAPRLTTNLR